MSDLMHDSKHESPRDDMIIRLGDNCITHVSFWNTFNKNMVRKNMIYDIRFYQSGYVHNGTFVPPTEIHLEHQEGISPLLGLKYFIKMISPYLENNPDG